MRVRTEAGLLDQTEWLSQFPVSGGMNDKRELVLRAVRT